MTKFFLYILWVLATIAIFIWYFTCTKHKKVPLLSVLFLFIAGFIPFLNIISTIFSLMKLVDLIDDSDVELKDNWFNRTFLAYNAK